MGCCGGRRGGGRGGGGNPQTVAVGGSGDTIILEYQGTKAGTMSRRGPVTKTWYTFGATPTGRRFACARADAAYLLRMGDLAVVPQEQPQPPAPATARAAPMPAPIPQVKPVAQPTTKAPVSLDEEPPADDLSEIKGITRDTAGILALVGVRTFGNLAALTDEGVNRAAQLTGKPEAQVKKWVSKAKTLAGAAEAEGDGDGIGIRDLGDVGLDLPDDV